jgi:ribosome-associated toxin RatA of RatAB toxin-antitoxin module
MITSLLSSPVTKRHVERKVIQTHALHLFQIVCDVDKYSQFLPLCIESKVLTRRRRHHRSSSSSLPEADNNNSSNKEEEEEEWMEAQLTVGLPPFFTERYVSRVHIVPNELMVETKSIQSKWLDSLSSRWKLTPILPKTNTATIMSHNSNGHNNNHDSQPPNKNTSSACMSSGSTSPPSCLVDFSVEITVSDPMIVHALDHVLRQVAGQQVAAFEQRCKQIPIPSHLLMHENRLK